MDRDVVRQGDILFTPVDKMPNMEHKPIATGIIAEGEATGHHHRVAVLEDAALFTCGWRENKYLSVGPNGVSIVHEEHHTVKLAPNTTYEVHQAREFDYLAETMRYVRD